MKAYRITLYQNLLIRAGRLKKYQQAKPLNDLGLKASPELIYQFIYSKIGLKNNLPSFLKFRRKKRGVRKSRKRKKSNIIDFELEDVYVT